MATREYINGLDLPRELNELYETLRRAYVVNDDSLTNSGIPITTGGGAVDHDSSHDHQLSPGVPWVEVSTASHSSAYNSEGEEPHASLTTMPQAIRPRPLPPIPDIPTAKQSLSASSISSSSGAPRKPIRKLPTPPPALSEPGQPPALRDRYRARLLPEPASGPPSNNAPLKIAPEKGVHNPNPYQLSTQTEFSPSSIVESEINEHSYQILRRRLSASSGSLASSSRGDPVYHAVTPVYDIHHTTSSLKDPVYPCDVKDTSAPSGNWFSHQARTRISQDLQNIANFGQVYPTAAQDIGVYDDISDQSPDQEIDEHLGFISVPLLSHLAVLLRDHVPRTTHVKDGRDRPRSFTGKDIVSTIQTKIRRELITDHNGSMADRRAALHVARSLQSQLFFYEVDLGLRLLQDEVKDIYMFPEDQEGGLDPVAERDELPTSVVTVLTKCYSLYCRDYITCPSSSCYSYSCPRRGIRQLPEAPEIPVGAAREEWGIPRGLTVSLSESAIERQKKIHNLVVKEGQFVCDLDIIESAFIRPLEKADPPVISPELIFGMFGNILKIRECNRRFLDALYIRQREQGYMIQTIGDVILKATNEFNSIYPTCIGCLPLADKMLNDEMDNNAQFRHIIEKFTKKRFSRSNDLVRLDLRQLLKRPSDHFLRYESLFEDILCRSSGDDPDIIQLQDAINVIRDLQIAVRLRTFQSTMGRELGANLAWHDLITPVTMSTFTKQECRRQAKIFELIKGEMAFVKDLENVNTIYIRPLLEESPPILSQRKREKFVRDVFHNFTELYGHHRKLVHTLHSIQCEEHPRIRSITEAVFDVAVSSRESYMEYIPNYPIAAYLIDKETTINPKFKAFVERSAKHPDAHGLDMKKFLRRPIERLIRHEELLKSILDETPARHDDRDTIPKVIDAIQSLAKETESGYIASNQRVEVWWYNSRLMFRAGEVMDLDLLDEDRTLMHSGKLLRQVEKGSELFEKAWKEVYVLLFNNYVVITKQRVKDGVMRYHVQLRPIPLGLLILGDFFDTPVQRSIEKKSGSQTTSSHVADRREAQLFYPFTICHGGRSEESYTLFAESSQVRVEWKRKLEDALVLRNVLRESKRVFDKVKVNTQHFLLPGENIESTTTPSMHEYTGRLTCATPIIDPNGRTLLAIGCEEGVWIGYRHDKSPTPMKRVTPLRMVTQCAVVDNFGIFLVLADKSLYAYRLEDLLPNHIQAGLPPPTPEKLGGSKYVEFFSVGTMQGRTFIIYMKRKRSGSVFHVLEPISDKINEKSKSSSGILNLPFLNEVSEWFKPYRKFFLPSEAYDLVFLKGKVAILCAEGFQIIDLNDVQSVPIPQRDHPELSFHAKRLESCRSLGIIKFTDQEFLLCYSEFGIYVNKRGEPSRIISTVEWEGNIERVAFHLPYVLLFDATFIEVRHVRTGKLCQIIRGSNIRCLWNGRPSNETVSFDNIYGKDFDNILPEPQVIAAMDQIVALNEQTPRNTLQHLCELVPVMPLRPADSLTYYSEPSSPQSPKPKSRAVHTVNI